MTTNEKSPSVVRRTAGCLWRLILLVIAIGLGIGLGVLLYYGGLYAYRGILAPINTNHVAVKVLDGEVRRTNDVFDAELKVRDERLRLLSEQLDERRRAMDALESRLLDRLAVQEEALRRQMASQQEALQSQIASQDNQRQGLMEAIQTQEQRGATLDRALQEQQAILQAQQGILQGQQEALDTQRGTLDVQQGALDAQQEALDAQREALDAQQGEIAQIAAAQGALETAITATTSELSGDIAALQKDFEAGMAGLEASFGALETEIGGPAPEEIAQVQRQTLLLKAAAQALRVRIRLVQASSVGATEDLAQLDDTLAALGELPEVDAEAVTDLRDQVAQIQIAFDENPFAVPDQVDALWLAITDLITP